VQARIMQDRGYREELLREGVECLLTGDLDTGKAILRDYINATIGFEKLSRLTGRPATSLMRMLGPRGSPQARNLFEVISQLQRIEGVHFELSLRAASWPGVAPGGTGEGQTVITKALEDAFRQARNLPESEQDELAAAIRAVKRVEASRPATFGRHVRPAWSNPNQADRRTAKAIEKLPRKFPACGGGQ
jgi:hypothetical protein